MFEDLAVGDKVAVYGGFTSSIEPRIVERVTVTTFQIDGLTYSRRDGKRRGARYSFAEAWTQEHDERLALYEADREDRRQRRRLSVIPWRTMDIAKVKAAIEALEAAGVLPAEGAK